MLYVTTRNNRDSVTAARVLAENRGEGGGLYMPMHFPQISKEEWKQFTAMSFNQRIAELLNRFFSTRLTGWDIDFCIGRYPVRVEQLAHKIFLAETWHNPQWQYSRMEHNLMKLLEAGTDIPGNWVSVAVRMAVMAAVLGSRELLGGAVDISVVSGDFALPVSAWYLRKMGFPVGNIICCCNENNQFWNLICNGQMHADAVCHSTLVPEADVVLPVNLERLICECGGIPEVERYLSCCESGGAYSVSDTVLQLLREGLFVSVVSSDRVETTIPNVYKTHGYVLAPASSLAYSGLMDYRTKTGITRPAVVFCDRNPACDLEAVAKAMDISAAQLNKLI